MAVERRAEHDVYVRELGDGPRRGLLLHCSLAHSGVWRGMAGHMPGCGFTAYDHLSHGRSADWNGAGDFHSANTAVGHSFLGEAPVDLIGHSFGGTVALRMALEAPERVRSLVLIEPVFFAVALTDTPELAQERRDDFAVFAQLIASGEREAAAKSFLDAWGVGVPWGMMPEEMRQDMIRRIHVITDPAEVIYNDSLGILDSNRLQALDMPVLLIRGQGSQEITREINEGLELRIPGATNAEVEGAGHMVPISHAKACAELILEFYDGKARV